jgi:protein SCO1/2
MFGSERGRRTMRDSMRLRQTIALLTCLLGTALPASAQLAGSTPEPLREVGVVEHLDTIVPLDAQFRDEDGRRVTLADYLAEGTPVILTLNYYRCPMLCGLQLNGFLEGLRQLEWSIGDRFQIVTISIDPLEGPELAAAKKASYLTEYGRAGAGEGWHFLTGGQPAIDAVADAVGFGYVYDEESAQYAHAAALMVLTPEGRVARYLYGVEYPPGQLRMALLEASRGEIGSTLDQVLLYCFHYDPSNRRYAPVAMNIMRVGGGLTASILGVALGLMWIRDIRSKTSRHQGTADA